MRKKEFRSVEAGGDQKDETGGRDGGSRGGGGEVLFGLDRIRNKSIRGTEDVDVWGQTEMGGWDVQRSEREGQL